MTGGSYGVQAIVFDSSGNLYAGGDFTSAGGAASTSYIARWNGSAWSALGSGMNDIIWALAFDSSWNLYAGGAFTTAGGAAANHIAKWDGNVWGALGSGTDSQIDKIAIDISRNLLYTCGMFSTAGGKAAAHVAMCNLNGSGTAVMPRKGDIVSQPFMIFDNHAGLMRFQLKSRTEVSYRIYSVLGRSIFSASEAMGPGDHSMRINTGHAARGTYIVHFKAGNESVRFRLVVDR